MATALLLILRGPAQAQGQAQGVEYGSPPLGIVMMSLGGSNQPLPASSTNPLPISGSFSTTGFAPGGNFANLTATASSADAALPSGAVVAVFNTGTSAVSCNFTVGAGTAAANETIIQPSSWIGITVGSNTHFSCINQAGDSASNKVVASGGSGLPSGAGGGGSVSILQGGNTAAVKGASTAAAAADPSLVTNESPNSQLSTAIGAVGAAASCAAGSNSTAIQCLEQLHTDITTAIPAGGNTIGNVNGAPNVTPTDCSGTITTGGTAQTLIAASTTIHGFQLQNIDSSAGSGELIWFSLTGTAAASTAASYSLVPPAGTTTQGFSYSTPFGFGINHAVSIIAATTGHKFSCTSW